MSDAVDNDALDALEACHCCLLGAQEHCMNTPLKNGEMYSDMLKECFSIQLAAANDKCGICTLCAARLRDAADLKRQVLRSQRQLRERLARAINIIEECPPVAVKLLIADDDGTSDNTIEPIEAEVRKETEDEDKCISDLYPDHMVKDEMVIGPERLQPADVTYTLQEECPPVAVKSLIADDDGTSDNTIEPIEAEVRKETEDEDKCISDLYPEHVVKDEMVIGPERLQPADVTYTLQAKVKPTPESGCDEQSRGTGECSDVNPSPDCVRPSQTQEATGADGLKTYQRTLLKRGFTCEVCGKTLKTFKHLKAHIRIHTGENPYACGMCTKKFKQLSHLKTHERIHTEKKPHACGICTRKFKHLSKLQVHERIHTGERPYACGMCTQKFKQLAHLKYHERTHTGERPYACGMCTKKFKHLVHLKRHEPIHTGERPYACGMCPKKYIRPTQLKIHEQMHSVEKTYCCSVCKKQFTHLGRFKRHERIHSDKKPYSCELCPRKFKQAGKLRRHKQIHTGK